MDKEKLIKLAEDLYQSAFDANAYYAIMMQYREMSKKPLPQTLKRQNLKPKKAKAIPLQASQWFILSYLAEVC